MCSENPQLNDMYFVCVSLTTLGLMEPLKYFDFFLSSLKLSEKRNSQNDDVM